MYEFGICPSQNPWWKWGELSLTCAVWGDLVKMGVTFSPKYFSITCTFIYIYIFGRNGPERNTLSRNSCRRIWYYKSFLVARVFKSFFFFFFRSWRRRRKSPPCFGSKGLIGVDGKMVAFVGRGHIFRSLVADPKLKGCRCRHNCQLCPVVPSFPPKLGKWREEWRKLITVMLIWGKTRKKVALLRQNWEKYEKLRKWGVLLFFRRGSAASQRGGVHGVRWR